MRIRDLFRPGAPWLLAFLLAAGLSAQVEELKHSNPKRRTKAAQKLGGLGDPQHIVPLRELLKDPVPDVRATAVDSIVRIGTQHSLDPLIEATRDSVPGIQIMAVDGLVNFYKIGYVGTGFKASLKNFGRNIRNRFAQPSEVIIEPYLDVSPDVVKTIARLIGGGSSMASRANAARAAGVLRGQAALPQLKEALRSKNTILILESVRAIEKIGDLKTGRSLTFLLHDLDENVQLAVVKAMGQLSVKESIPELVGLVRTSSEKKIRRQSLIALAKMPDSGQRSIFLVHLKDRDHQVRAASAEGIGRAGEKQDLKMILDAFANERSESARLSMAFAAVYLGDMSYASYLIDALNSLFHRGEARPFLVELARKPEVLSRLYDPLTKGTKYQKTELCHVISVSGNRESLPHLERLTHDADSKVAQVAIRALRNLQARL